MTQRIGLDCLHCPDGHRHPGSKSMAVTVGSERDSDGQPTTLHVSYTNLHHVSDVEAQWLRDLLAACDDVIVTMSTEAAERFLKALSYATSIVDLRAEELADSEGTSRRVQTAKEHSEWLRWGYGRTSHAKFSHEEARNDQ